MIVYHVGTALTVLWFVFRGNDRLDYRLAALGAILPDLIDKPIGRVFFRDQFNSGRIFGHTLLFNVTFFCVFFFLRGRIKRKLVLIPAGALLHLAFDGLISNPRVLWWPLFGPKFPRSNLEGGLLSYLDPTAHPEIWIQEAIGLLLLVWLLAAHRKLSANGIGDFLRTGRLSVN